MESSGSVGKLKRDEPSLFRGESPGFVDLPLSQHVAKHTDQETRMDCEFIALSYIEEGARVGNLNRP